MKSSPGFCEDVLRHKNCQLWFSSPNYYWALGDELRAEAVFQGCCCLPISKHLEISWVSCLQLFHSKSTTWGSFWLSLGRTAGEGDAVESINGNTSSKSEHRVRGTVLPSYYWSWIRAVGGGSERKESQRGLCGVKWPTVGRKEADERYMMGNGIGMTEKSTMGF